MANVAYVIQLSIKLNHARVRVARSQRLSKFPQIEKLWNGTDADQKSLMDQWLQTDGNEDKVEAHFKVALQVQRGVEELEEKLTIKQMKEKGFSK